MKGVRYLLRNFTALSVKEHLSSQIKRGSAAELTSNEIDLVRFAAERSAELTELADGSPTRRQLDHELDRDDRTENGR